MIKIHLWDKIGKRDGNITGDSRKVKAGDIFFALPGITHHEEFYCQEALKRGCGGVVIEKKSTENFREIFINNGRDVDLWSVENIRREFVLALRQSLDLAKNSHPIFAVTGTNGKTTITYLLRHLIDIPMAIIGTIRYNLIEKIIPAKQTTPDLEDLYRMIAGLPKHAALAIELSSHALDQGRAYDLDIDTGIFSNLTGDHLDYHRNCEDYFLAKRKLFSGENGTKPKRNILNLNDSYGRRLNHEFGGITYGVEHFNGDYNAIDLRFFIDKTTFTLEHEGKKYFCEIPLLGTFNVENVLAAMAAIHESRGIALEHLIERVKIFPGVLGRLQPVKNNREITILVDHAHTEDGLRRVLESLQKIKRRHITTIFGCGGDRDRTKRPRMMHVACQFSDLVVATFDNPRHESIEVIFDDMRRGVIPGSSVIFEPDRQKAIASVLDKAQKGDMILVAGKGHETYQQIGDEKIPYSDVDTINKCL
jgi:UDP-N-acetylmuramoyl-L-alanyl-D-glutamate--2,6-diaminopimelate ligase